MPPTNRQMMKSYDADGRGAADGRDQGQQGGEDERPFSAEMVGHPHADQGPERAAEDRAAGNRAVPESPTRAELLLQDDARRRKSAKDRSPKKPAHRGNQHDRVEIDGAGSLFRIGTIDCLFIAPTCLLPRKLQSVYTAARRSEKRLVELQNHFWTIREPRRGSEFCIRMPLRSVCRS